MTVTPSRFIYIDALLNIGHALEDIVLLRDNEMKEELLEYASGVRQSREARVARKALKDASYERMFGGSEES